MDWFNVKDTLPEHGEEVIAVYKNEEGNDIMVMAHYVQRWAEESYGDGICEGEVLSWAYLPSAPVDEGELK